MESVKEEDSIKMEPISPASTEVTMASGGTPIDSSDLQQSNMSELLKQSPASTSTESSSMAPVVNNNSSNRPGTAGPKPEPSGPYANPTGNNSNPVVLSPNEATITQAQTYPKTEPNAEPFVCHGCTKKITDRYLLRSLDKYWHEDCLKCECCDCRLGEVGATLYTKGNLILCKRDYLRLFGMTGYCAACNKTIPAFEMVMRARNNVYHLECFACQECNHRFCVGDRFYLCDNKILCEYDYEERMVFANISYNYSSLAMLKRQIQNNDDLDEIPPMQR